MTFFFIVVACTLTIAATLVLRTSFQKGFRQMISATLFTLSIVLFICAYGAIAGIFTGLAAVMVIGLSVSICLGKSHP